MIAERKEPESSGLSTAEAQQRLSRFGYNELSPPQTRHLWHIIADVLREPMFLLLIAAGSIYLLLGDVEDALMLLFFVALIVVLTVSQQRKSERVLEALRDLSSPRARVLRDGKPQRIAGREVVTGDLLLLTEGDRVAADAVLLSCNDLQADESMLTGESVPVRKRPGSTDSAAQQPGGDDQPFVYAGTVLVQGSGIGLVTATGKSSAIGQIGKSLQIAQPGASPLRLQTGHLVRRLAILASILCLILVIVYGVTRGHWLDALLAGITLAMASLPEEFPVILTVFMALGAWRISKRNVLTRRLDAIETLGATTVLCADKTGTLTENRMVIRKLYSGEQMLQVDAHSPLPEPWHELVEFGILASEREPFDPMERALHELGKRTLSGTEHLHQDWQIVHEYSLSPGLMAMSHVWQGDGQEHHMVAAKGAPEAIIDLCHLPEAQAGTIEQAAAEMADQGLRVLGVARAKLQAGQEWPAQQHDIEFSFVGLLGLHDPLRTDVTEAIAQCHAAGIRVVMITGDHAHTAQAIAAELGLPGTQILTGSDLDALSDEALRARLRDVQVFARIVPQQKLRLVEAFKANGEIVAMTGDGVNDAPALKAAHIGVAMGKRGTDVAREAAGLVLLNDDFASLAATIRLGRRIYDNLRKAMSYALAVHIPIVGMALLPVLLGEPLLLLPAHIMYLQLIIDPACSIFFEAEPEEKNIMQRPPRQANEPLFGGKLMTNSLLQGSVAFAVAAAIYAWALSSELDEDTVRALVFVSMVAGNIALVFSNRSLNASWPDKGQGTWSRENPVLWWIVLGGSVGLALVLSVPVLRELFHFSGDAPHIIGVGVLSALGVLLLSTGVKRIMGARK